MQASASDLSDASSVPGAGHKKRASRQLLHQASPSVPISITKAAPSTATASTSSTDIASSASSLSEYHSTQSPTASALLAHLSPRPRPRSRADSVTSSTDDAPLDGRDGFAAGADTSSDGDSLRTTLRHRRRPSVSAGPALLRQRPASIATTASSVTAFELGQLDDDGNAQSVASTSKMLSDPAGDISASPSISRRSKSKGKASTTTLLLRASPRVAESHLSPNTLQVPTLDHKASKVAEEKLRKLQQRASTSGADHYRPAHNAPQEAREVLGVDHDGALEGDGNIIPSVPAGHSEALLQEDALRRSEEAELATLVDERTLSEHPAANTDQPHDRLSVVSPDDGDSQTGRSISSRLRRRKGCRALGKRHSQSSLSDTDDESGPRTSSSSLDERLSNAMYTKSQSASKVWLRKHFDQTTKDLSAIEKQIEEDSNRVKLANQGMLDRTFADDDGGNSNNNNNKIALNVSLHIQFPGLATVTKAFLHTVMPATSPHRDSPAPPPSESARRRPDLLRHQFRRQDVHLTEILLDRRSTTVKLMILGVLFGSWFGKTVGLL